MKKVLSVLSLIAIISLASPAFAGPPGGPRGPGGPGGPGMGGRPPMHGGQGHHIAPPPPHRPHGGFVVHAGSPRHSYWRSYRAGYWGNSWCDYRLGWCNPCPPPPPPPCTPHAGVYFPMGGAGISVRF